MRLMAKPLGHLTDLPEIPSICRPLMPAMGLVSLMAVCTPSRSIAISVVAGRFRLNHVGPATI